MAAPAVLGLPESLLLLVHLHILQYTHANDAAYDEHIFNPRVRGLRERAKTMEDVAYFLVGRVEGKVVKTILTTYPCLQPSEALAFRTSFAKYLESLRHQSIFSSSSRSSGKGPAQDVGGETVAWWWKDVAVRKSLIEECSGEKFERLMLSLSTHALMKASHSIPPNSMSSLLRSQPIAYAAALAQYHSTRHSWTRSSSLLVRWEQDLVALRARLRSQGEVSSKYRSLSTSRLHALANTKLQDLRDQHWQSQSAQVALSFVIDLAGLNLASPSSTRKGVGQAERIVKAVHPSPLPVAAAHHPAHLKKLRRPIFQTRSTANPDSPAVPIRSHAEIVLAAHVESEKRMRQALSEATSRCRKHGMEMRSQLASVSICQASGKVDFWTSVAAHDEELQYEPLPSKELLAALHLSKEFDLLNSDVQNDDALEKRVEEIRTNVLMQYPPIPDASTPRLPPQGPLTSKIPPASAAIKPTKPGGAVRLPQPPAMSPTKSARSMGRKSVRFSTARRRTGRPSMFRAFVDDEVGRLIDETHDFSTDDDCTDNNDVSFHKTPRSKRKTPKANRIWTPGARGGNTPRARQQSIALVKLFDMEPDMLPSLGSSTSSMDSENEGLGVQGKVEVESEEIETRFLGGGDATPKPIRGARRLFPREEDGSGDDNEEVAEDEDEDDFFGDDPPSMTLKDILLSADTSNFDLLETGGDDIDLVDGLLVEDASFVWE